MTITEQLESLQNRPTRYEVVAIRDSERVLISYTSMHSRSGLLKACQNRGQAIIAAFGITDNDRVIAAPKASDGFTVGGWALRFSGRTQRQAIIEGELPFICDLAEQTVTT